MNGAGGESLMTCMYCYDLLPQKDLVYHINYECRYARGNMLSEIESSFGHYEPQSGSQERKGSYSDRIFSPNFSSPLTLFPFKPALSCPNSAEIKNQSSTTQAGVPASIIDKENPKYEELSSLNAKEKKNQSSTTQVDVPESIIDKENPKYQELSSLDAKDVSLLTESMKELLMKSKNHDVKIIVNDKEFQAHRLILSARSRVFAMMLNHDTKESNTGTITIEDCDPDSFDEFLLYLYSGRTEDLTPNKALHLYYTADKYDLPALKKRCAILLKKSLSVESICDIVILAAKHDEKELLEAATEFFARNIRKILQTVNWQKFLSKNPVEGNELYIKSLDILLPINEE